MKKKSELKQNIILCLIFTLLPLYAAEIFVATVWHKDHNLSFAEKTFKLAQAGTKIQKIMKLRSIGVDAQTNFNAGILLEIPRQYVWVDGKSFLPLGGIANKTIVNCNESGRWSIFESDEYGFNNPRGSHSLEKTDFLFLGDSIIEGACVENKYSIAGLFRNKGYKVLNLGRGGNGPILNLAALREYGARLQPKTVLWYYSEGNDLRDIYERWRDNYLNLYVTDEKFSQNLVKYRAGINQANIDFVKEREKKELEKDLKERELNAQHSSLLKHPIVRVLKVTALRGVISTAIAGNASIQKFQDSVYGDDHKSRKLLKIILSQAKQKVESWGGEFVFVYLPTHSRYDLPKKKKNYLYRDDVLLIAEKLNIKTIDVDNVFEKHPDPLSLFPFRLHGHYNETGYSLVSEYILNQLEKIQLSRR